MRFTPQAATEAINAAFLKIPKAEIHHLLRQKTTLSLRCGMSMKTAHGHRRLIEVQLRPWIVDTRQVVFFHRTCLLLRQALAKVMPLYLANPEVRKVVPLSEEEHAWLMDVNGDRCQRPQAVLDRLDATATFATSDWKRFWFLEPNAVGIGGIHYIPAARQLSERWVLPTLKRHLPNLALDRPIDIRQLLTGMLLQHARAIGRKLRRVALIEDRSDPEGTEEFPWLARYLSLQLGIAAVVADPRDIELRRGELTVKAKPVDMFYRDSELAEIIEMAKDSGLRSVEGIREAFRQNRVISSIAGEFDHKSVWELFTHPQWTRYFTEAQRKLFRQHIPWTRLLWERKVLDPNGRTVDLVAFARSHQEWLTLKPNRAYGGKGVVFGCELSRLDWERQLERALSRPGTTVIQKRVDLHSELFPVIHPDGSVQLEPYYVVSGFAATADGLAILGRASKEAVVNVSRKGGLIAVWQLG